MIGFKIYYVNRLCFSVRSIAHNGKGLCAVGDFGDGTFKRITELSRIAITFNLRNFSKNPQKLRKKLRFFSKQKQKNSKYLIIREKKFSKKV